eukprot:2180399-Lingulodinium_polyedra.AAC.1
MRSSHTVGPPSSSSPVCSGRSTRWPYMRTTGLWPSPWPSSAAPPLPGAPAGAGCRVEARRPSCSGRLPRPP